MKCRPLSFWPVALLVLCSLSLSSYPRGQASFELTSREYPPHPWNEYRISDGIARKHGAAGCESFPDTILCSYLKETSKSNDIPALIRVLNLTQYRRPELDESTVIVHVRIGDGLCAQYDYPCRGDRTNVPDCWNNYEDCFFNPESEGKFYALSKKWYIPVLQKLSFSNEARNVVIVGDMRHWTRTLDPRNGNFSVDEAYLLNLAHFWREFFPSVRVQVNNIPDEDFILLCSARVFVQGGGGYSALVADIVRARGGTVINPIDQTMNTKSRFQGLSQG